MFHKQTNINETALRMQIDSLFEKMSDPTIDKHSTEYAAMVAQMDVLYKLREIDSKVNSGKRVSPDVWVTVAANLVGIAMITDFERARVITSKALGLVGKLR